MSEEKQPDWALIEAEYRAGVKSLRQIGADHGVSEGAIRKRAKKDEWTRDLASRIQAKADELVRTEVVRNTVRSEGDAYPVRMTTPEKAATEREVVEVNAQQQFMVRMQSREDVLRLERLVRSLMGELELYTNDREALEELGELITGKMDEQNAEQQDLGAENIARKLNRLYSRVLSSADRIDSAKKLVDMLDKLVMLKFKIFGVKLDDDNNGGGGIEDQLRKLAEKTGDRA